MTNAERAARETAARIEAAERAERAAAAAAKKAEKDAERERLRKARTVGETSINRFVLAMAVAVFVGNTAAIMLAVLFMFGK